jgi:DNA-binding MarR family transcriptional regulator/GNAT superfamily N-acetyltransferase
MSELAVEDWVKTSKPADDTAIAEVRGFNRFYTNVIGLLRGKYLGTPYSLTEARLLFELAQRDASEVTDLRRVVDIDPGYLSRILARFSSDGLITRQRSAADGRRQVIRLTATGHSAVAGLDTRSAEQTRDMLAGVHGDDRRRLLEAMRAITEILTGSPRPRGYLLRAPRPGDMGWVVQRNGAIYAEEFGWDASYEALVARIVADYVENRDPDAEAAWIAEVDGAPAGCVFCVREDAATARLRLLLVEPWARGLGIGARLVDEVLRFARQAGYARITLWTNDVLGDARRIYQRAGFTLDSENRHHSFGKDLVGQNWSRALLRFGPLEQQKHRADEEAHRADERAEVDHGDAQHLGGPGNDIAGHGGEPERDRPGQVHPGDSPGQRPRPPRGPAVAGLEPGQRARGQEACRAEHVGAPDVMPRLCRADGRPDGGERADVELDGAHELHAGGQPVDPMRQEHEDLPADAARPLRRGVDRLPVLEETG